MSNYTDYIGDLAKRCIELLDDVKEHGRKSDREVTLLLSLANPAFVIPFERLRHDPIKGYKPLHNDRTDYELAATKLENLRGLTFRESPLYPDVGVASLRFGVVPFNDTPLQDLDFSNCIDSPGTNDLLEVIRNGFAHGNLLTRGSGEKIEELVFVRGAKVGSKGRVGEIQDFMCSPGAFESILRKWCAFLTALPLKDLRLPLREPGGDDG